MNGRLMRSAAVVLILAIIAVLGATLGFTGCHDAVRDANDSTAGGLEAEHWKLVWLAGHPVTTGNNGREAYLVFDPQKRRAQGNTGCNGFSGKYVLDGNQVGLTEIISTKMACEGMMEQESAFLNALQATARWNRSGSRLELYDTAGTTLAAFEASH